MLVFAHKLTPRLQYICDFIFAQQFGISYSTTTDVNIFEEYQGPKINYSTSSTRSRYTLHPANLLFENTISQQSIDCFEHNGSKAFFETSRSDFYLDIFAATFYLLSRYEEYLPHKKDLYGRYAHQNSLAFREDFLQQPLVNIWLRQFAESLQKVYPEIVFKENSFSFLPTYDIDIAWSFKNKGFLRGIGSFLKKPSLQRLQVMQGKEKDPYDCYAFLDRLHAEFSLQPLYFFLVAGSRGRYDKNSSLTSADLQELIKEHSRKYKVGVHPSWKSYAEPILITKEKKYLEDLLPVNMAIDSSRQHYIKFDLPGTFQNLIAAGIRNDYSMGYGTVNGFRASIASSFYWYDLSNEKQTELLLHPFCFMDATSAFQQDQSAKDAFAEMLYYYSVCKEVNGSLITIFHNNILGGDAPFEDWPAMYERFIAAVANE